MAVVQFDATNAGLSFRKYPLGIAATSMKLGDVDGDGHVDVVLGCGPGPIACGPKSLSVLRGRGDGSFDQPTVITHPAVYKLAVVDLDVDGKAEVLVVAGEMAPCSRHDWPKLRHVAGAVSVSVSM